MSLEELLEFRKQVVANKEKFTLLNHHYNEMLTKKHSMGLNKSKKRGIDKRVKNSKAYKVIQVLNCIIPFVLGCLLITSGRPGVCLLALLSYNFISSVIINDILPRIILGKGYKDKINKDDDAFNQAEADELYVRLCEARELFHRSKKEFDTKLNNISITDQELYQEYLDAIDGYIEVLESTEPETSKEVSESIQGEKKLNLE